MRGRSTAIALAVLSSFFVVACGEGDGGTTPTPTPTVTVTFQSAAPTLSQGDTASVSATASNGSAVTYTSSNAGVASVTASGLVTGVTAGTATITASSGTASATLDVTVNAFTPTITIDQITQNGQPIDPADVSGTIDIAVSAEVSNTFDGELVIMFGDTEVTSEAINGGAAGAGGAGGGAAASGARIGVSRIKSVQTDAPLAVTDVGAEVLDNGSTDVTALLRSLPNVDVTSDPVGVTLNNPNAAFLRIRGVSAISTTGTRYDAPDFLDGVYINRDANDSRTVLAGEILMSQIQHVTVLRGPQNAVYGKNATAGVVSIDLDKNTDYTQGGNAFGGITGRYRLTARFRLSDNTWIEPQMIYPTDLPGGEVEVDTWSASYVKALTWNLPAGANPWLGLDIDVGNWAKGVGGDWTAGDIADAGVGLDTCDSYMGPDLQNLVPTSNSNELSETQGLSLRYAWGCSDKLDNFDFIWLNNPLGADFTAPSGSLRVGANYLGSGYTPNPAPGTVFGFTGTDAASGFDAGTLFLGMTRYDAGGFAHTLGSDDGNGTVVPEKVDLTTPGEYADIDLSTTGLYSLRYGYTDFAGNITPYAGLWYANDAAAPSVSGLNATGLTAGQQATVTGNVTDDLAVKAYWAVTDYGGFRVAFDWNTAWKPGDTNLQQSIDASMTNPWSGSVEVVDQFVFQPPPVKQAQSVSLYAEDAGNQGNSESTDVSGTSTGGRTVSMALRGTDGLFYGLSARIEILNPENGDDGSRPTTATLPVSAFTAGTGASDIEEFSLYAEVSLSSDISTKFWQRVAPWTTAVRADFQGYFEQSADVEIDFGQIHYRLPGGGYKLRLAARDADNNLLFGAEHPGGLLVITAPYNF